MIRLILSSPWEVLKLCSDLTSLAFGRLFGWNRGQLAMAIRDSPNSAGVDMTSIPRHWLNLTMTLNFAQPPRLVTASCPDCDVAWNRHRLAGCWMCGQPGQVGRALTCWPPP